MVRSVSMHGMKEELCVIVNEENEVIGAEPRSRTVSQRLLGRGSYCLVLNEKRELLVSRRSLKKDVYPGLLDTVISGVCQYGEDYLDTAIRELVEELGLNKDQEKVLSSESRLTPLGIFPYKDRYCHVFGCAFLYRHSGPISLQEDEVDAAQWMPLADVEGLLQDEDQVQLEGSKTEAEARANNKFTPVGKHILQTFKNQIKDA